MRTTNSKNQYEYFFLCVEVYQKWYVTLTDIPTKEKLANVVNISIM